MWALNYSEFFQTRSEDDFSDFKSQHTPTFSVLRSIDGDEELNSDYRTFYGNSSKIM